MGTSAYYSPDNGSEQWDENQRIHNYFIFLMLLKKKLISTQLTLALE